MGSSLSYMSKTERLAVERFGDAVKSRLGEICGQNVRLRF